MVTHGERELDVAEATGILESLAWPARVEDGAKLRFCQIRDQEGGRRTGAKSSSTLALSYDSGKLVT